MVCVHRCWGPRIKVVRLVVESMQWLRIVKDHVQKKDVKYDVLLTDSLLGMSDQVRGMDARV